jgi:hypothetical protein
VTGAIFPPASSRCAHMRGSDADVPNIKRLLNLR